MQEAQKADLSEYLETQTKGLPRVLKMLPGKSDVSAKQRKKAEEMEQLLYSL